MKKYLTILLVAIISSLLAGCFNLIDTDLENYRDPSYSNFYNYPEPDPAHRNNYH